MKTIIKFNLFLFALLFSLMSFSSLANAQVLERFDGKIQSIDRDDDGVTFEVIKFEDRQETDETIEIFTPRNDVAYNLDIQKGDSITYVPSENTFKIVDWNERILGEILSFEFNDVDLAGQPGIERLSKVELDSDDRVIETSEFFASEEGITPLEIGDKVVLDLTISQTENIAIYNIVDFDRINSLVILILIFAVLTLFVAKRKGLFSLGGLVISFLIIFFFILPNLANGNNPFLIAVVASLLIIPTNYYLSHGFNRKSSIAVVGTIITLLFGILMTEIFVNFANLSGVSSEEALYLNISVDDISIKGILLASIIIGLLGILDDITISQSAIAFEIYKTNPNLGFKALYLKSMNVGKDHIASLVNTLILVYTGSALPLLLIFETEQRDFIDFVNREFVAEEIVRTLIASICLILAVPITTFFAAAYLSRFKPDPKSIPGDEHHHHH